MKFIGSLALVLFPAWRGVGQKAEDCLSEHGALVAILDATPCGDLARVECCGEVNLR